jgi:hypothetical protein
MITPTKGIAPQRSLLAVGAQILNALDRPQSVNQTWLRVQEWRTKNDHHAPLPFWWFVLALDTLYSLGLIDLESELLVVRRINAAQP